MQVAAILVAAGKGERAGANIPKQYRVLGEHPVLEWSLRAFAAAGVDDVVVVAAAGHEQWLDPILARWPAVKRAAGGAVRTQSVRAGLAAAGGADVVLVHDAARPGLTPAMISTLVDAIAAGAPAVAPALAVADTLRRADAAGWAMGDVDRAGLMRVQTPQTFAGEVLRRAYAAAPLEADFTDDIAVVEAAGVRARMIAGDPLLMKLTYNEDFAVLERMLGMQTFTCVGHGVDAHRFGSGDHVTLCGVQIPHDKGLVGHSDADAGWHALVDAILGALGQGDIGAHFPPSDPQWRGANSERFLRHAASLAANAGARIMHVDVTLICERPKIGPHREAMRARTAEALGLPLDRVSVKATTTERMGFTGREEGLAAQATATLERPR